MNSNSSLRSLPFLLPLLLLLLREGCASRGGREDTGVSSAPSHAFRNSHKYPMVAGRQSSMGGTPLDLQNSSSFPSLDQFDMRQTYLYSQAMNFPDHQMQQHRLPGHQLPFQLSQHKHQQHQLSQHQLTQHQLLQHELKPPRTWKAEPEDYPGDPDTTTRDPAIPENPEGLNNPSLLTGLWEEEPTVRVTNAVFRGENGSIVGAQAGTTANLPCVIVNRADHETVSWIRLRDHHLITVGRQTYSNDDRFSVTYNRHRNEWTLHLRYAQSRDAGEYVCQLSTHPPMVFISTLTITEASAEIEGGPERYVHEGSAVVLTCLLSQHTQPPEYVFWFHNRTMINFDTNRQVSVRNTRDGSVLTLAAVGRTDSGNYTCQPANARPASITLHIILGDTPAAMQVSSVSVTRPHLLVHLLLLLLLHTFKCSALKSSSVSHLRSS